MYLNINNINTEENEKTSGLVKRGSMYSAPSDELRNSLSSINRNYNQKDATRIESAYATDIRNDFNQQQKAKYEQNQQLERTPEMDSFSDEFFNTVAPYINLSDEEKQYYYEQVGRMMADGQNPRDWAEQVLTISAVADANGVTREEALRNWDKSCQTYYGELKPVKFKWGAGIINAIQQGWQQDRMASIANDYRNLFVKGYDEDSEEVQQTLQAYRNRQQLLEYNSNTATREGLVEKVAGWADDSIQNVVYMGKGVVAGAVGGFGLGAISGGTMAGLGAHMARVGTYFTSFAGESFMKMKEAGVDTDVAIKLSGYEGFINALNEDFLDTITDKGIGLANKGLEKIGIKTFEKKAVIELARDAFGKTTEEMLKTNKVGKYVMRGLFYLGSDAGGEFLQESTQQLTTDAFILWAKNMSRKDGEEKEQWNNPSEMRDAFEAGLQGAYSGLFWASFSGAVNPAHVFKAPNAFKYDAERTTLLKDIAGIIPSKEAFVKSEAVNNIVNDMRDKDVDVSDEKVKEAIGNFYDNVQTSRATIAKMTAEKTEANNGKAPLDTPEGMAEIQRLDGRIRTDITYADTDKDGISHYRITFGSSIADSVVNKGKSKAYGMMDVYVDKANNTATIKDVGISTEYTHGAQEMVRTAIENHLGGYDVDWDTDGNEVNDIIKQGLINSNVNGANLNFSNRDARTNEKEAIYNEIMASNGTRTDSGMDLGHRSIMMEGDAMYAKGGVTEQEARMVVSIIESLADKYGMGIREFVDKELGGQVIINEDDDRYRRMQKEAPSARGFSEMSKGLKGAIYVAQHGDFSTFNHELFHLALRFDAKERKNLIEKVKAIFKDEKKIKRLKSYINEHSQIFGEDKGEEIVAELSSVKEFKHESDILAKKYEKIEEDLTQLYEAWLTDKNKNGFASKEVAGILEKIAEAIKKVYQILKDNNVIINPELEEAFVSIMGLDRKVSYRQQTSEGMSYDVNGSARHQGYNWEKGMSNNAVSAYEDGEKPISKWTKNDFIEAIDEYAPEKFKAGLKKIPVKTLKDKLLINSSWHHTGKLFNRTNFYRINTELLEDMTDLDYYELTGDKENYRDEFIRKNSEKIEKYNYLLREAEGNDEYTISYDGNILKKEMEQVYDDSMFTSMPDSFKDFLSAGMLGLIKSKSEHYYKVEEKPTRAEYNNPEALKGRKRMYISYTEESDHLNAILEEHDGSDWKTIDVWKDAPSIDIYQMAEYVQNGKYRTVEKFVMENPFNRLNSSLVSAEEIQKAIKANKNSIPEGLKGIVDSIRYQKDGETESFNKTESILKSNPSNFDSEGNHLAPNGKPSNLSYDQWVQTRTPEFKKWFGDWENDPENASKIVDENGEPKEVYHFSYEKFIEFDPMQARMAADIVGSFFAPNEDDPSYGDNKYSMFLNIKNPAINPKWKPFSSDRAGLEERNKLISEGYDGVINTDSGEVSEYIAFFPNQIKSAIDNNGNFDINDDRFRYQQIGPIGAELIDSAEKSSALSGRLETARQMYKEGKTNQEIFVATGWYAGSDGNWKFEIPDNMNNINLSAVRNLMPNRKASYVMLPEVYTSEWLYNAYPELKDIKVLRMRENASWGGEADWDNKVLALKTSFKYRGMSEAVELSDKAVAGTIVHELQHFIQHKEGFASGGNEYIASDLKKKYDLIGSNNDIYLRFGGEVEARNASKRLDSSYRNIVPTDTEGIDVDKYIKDSEYSKNQIFIYEDEEGFHMYEPSVKIEESIRYQFDYYAPEITQELQGQFDKDLELLPEAWQGPRFQLAQVTRLVQRNAYSKEPVVYSVSTDDEGMKALANGEYYTTGKYHEIKDIKEALDNDYNVSDERIMDYQEIYKESMKKGHVIVSKNKETGEPTSRNVRINFARMKKKTADRYNKAGELVEDNSGSKVYNIPIFALTRGCQRSRTLAERVLNGLMDNGTEVVSCYGGKCFVNLQQDKRYGNEFVDAMGLEMPTPDEVDRWFWKYLNDGTKKAKSTIRNFIGEASFIREGAMGCSSHSFVTLDGYGVSLAETWLKNMKEQDIRCTRKDDPRYGMPIKSIFITAGYAPVTVEDYKRLLPYKDWMEIHVSMSGWFSNNELLMRMAEFEKMREAGLNPIIRVISNKENISDTVFENEKMMLSMFYYRLPEDERWIDQKTAVERGLIEDREATEWEKANPLSSANFLETPFHDDKSHKSAKATGLFPAVCCEVSDQLHALKPERATGQCLYCSYGCGTKFEVKAEEWYKKFKNQTLRNDARYQMPIETDIVISDSYDFSYEVGVYETEDEDNSEIGVERNLSDSIMNEYKSMRTRGKTVGIVEAHEKTNIDFNWIDEYLSETSKKRLQPNTEWPKEEDFELNENINPFDWDSFYAEKEGRYQDALVNLAESFADESKDPEKVAGDVTKASIEIIEGINLEKEPTENFFNIEETYSEEPSEPRMQRENTVNTSALDIDIMRGSDETKNKDLISAIKNEEVLQQVIDAIADSGRNIGIVLSDDMEANRKAISDNAPTVRELLADVFNREDIRSDKSNLPQIETIGSLVGEDALGEFNATERKAIASSISDVDIAEAIKNGTITDQQIIDAIARKDAEITELKKKLDVQSQEEINELKKKLGIARGMATRARNNRDRYKSQLKDAEKAYSKEEREKDRKIEQLNSLIKKQGERKALAKMRDYKQKLAKSLFRKWNANVDYRTVAPIMMEIRNTLDPKFARTWLYDPINNPGMTAGGETIDIEQAKAMVNGFEAGMLDANNTGIDKAELKRRLGSKLYNQLRGEGPVSLSDMPIDELEALNDRLNRAWAEGRQIRSAQLEAIRQRRQDSIDTITDTIRGMDRFKNAKLSARGTRKGKESRLRGALYSTMRMQELARELDGADGYENRSILVESVRDAQTKEMDAIEKRMMPVQDVIEELGADEVTDFMYQYQYQANWDENTEFTGSELSFIYLSQLNEKAKDAVMYGCLITEEEQGYTTGHKGLNGKAELKALPNVIIDDEELRNTAEQRYDEVVKEAENILRSTGMMKLVDAISKDLWNPENGQKLLNFSLDAFNKPVVLESFYIPLKRRDVSGTEDIESASDILSMTAGHYLSKVADGFLTEKKKIGMRNQKPINMDLMGVWANSVQEQEHLFSTGELLADINAIYENSPEVRDVITKAFGKEMINEISDYIKYIADPTYNDGKDDAGNVFKMFQGSTALAYLGFKTTSIINQLIFSPVPFFGEANNRDIMACYWELLVHPVNTWSFIIDKSTMMKTRSSSVIIEAIKELKALPENSTANKISKMWGNITGVGMMGLELVDKYCVGAGWLAVYKTSLNKYLADGLSTDEAEKKAVKDADEVVLRTQPTGTKTELARQFRSNKPLLRLILQFQTALNTVYNTLIVDTYQDIDTIRNSKDSDKKGEAMKRLIGHTVGFALAGWFYESMKARDDDDEDKTVLNRIMTALLRMASQGIQSVTFVGSSLYNGMDAILDKKPLQNFLNLGLFPALESTGKGTFNLATAIAQEDEKKKKSMMKKAFYNLERGVGLFLGIPVSAIKQYKKAWEDKSIWPLLF